MLEQAPPAGTTASLEEVAIPATRDERVRHVMLLMSSAQWRGQHGELAAAWSISEGTVKHYAAEASRRLKALPTPAAEPPAPPPPPPALVPLEELATELFKVESALDVQERAAKTLRAAMLKRMEAEAVQRVPVNGGLISYTPASTSHPVDPKACATRIGVLVEQLHALGATDVDGTIPVGTSTRSASLRITFRAPDPA